MSEQDRLQHTLQAQAQQIERVFAEHQLPVQVMRGEVNGGSTRYDLFAPLAVGLEQLRQLRDRLVAALRVPSVHLTREEGRLRVELVQATPPPVDLLTLLDSTESPPPLTAVLGIDDEGYPIWLDFNADEVTHVFIAGSSGAGKSILLQSCLLSLALHTRQAQLQLVVIDPAGRSGQSGAHLRALDYVPHLMMPVVPNGAAALEALRFIADEVDYRLQHGWRWPRIVIAIDNLDDLVETQRESLHEALGYLLQHGARAGVHLILSARQPRALGFDRLLKSYLTVRLVGQVHDTVTARAASGVRDSQAESLAGAGDFVLLYDEARYYFQAAYVGDYDLRFSLQRLQRPTAPRLLAQSLAADASVRRPTLQRPAATAARQFQVEPDSGAVHFPNATRTQPQPPPRAAPRQTAPPQPAPPRPQAEPRPAPPSVAAQPAVTHDDDFIEFGGV